MTTIRMIAASSLLALAAGTASAATVTQNFDLGPSTLSSGTATFDKFDSAQGVLNSVTLTLGADFITQLFAEKTIEGRDSTARNASFFDTFFRFAGGDLFDLIEVDTPDGTFDDVTSSVLGEQVFGKAIARSHSVTLTSGGALDLAKFIGTGTFDVALGVYSTLFGFEENGTSSQWSSNGNGLTGIRTDYSLSASLTYDFAPAPVPLPAAGLLLLAAVGGLGAAARRRASTNA